MKLKPKFARVLMERALPEKMGSIIVPSQYAKRNAETWGVVRAVGETCDDSIKELIGKTVMFGRFAGDWIRAPDGTEYYICQDEDILAEVSGATNG